MEKTVVLYPGLAFSHFVPMMELAKVFLKHGYAVSVAFIDGPDTPPSLALAVDHVVSSHQSISLHRLLPPATPPTSSCDNANDFLINHYNLIKSYNEPLHRFVCSLLGHHRVHALVVDVFSIDALDVAEKLGVPTYVFHPSGATSLAVYLQLPCLSAKFPRGFGELGDTPLELFGVLPMPASHLSKEMHAHPQSDLYRTSLSKWARVLDADGIIVNTFQSLESRAVEALNDPRCVPNKALPPVFCVGPLLQTTGVSTASDQKCLTWLDEQPDRSVVFLCFGSDGTHRAEQLREIAVGLEMSGHRFLWVVQAPSEMPHLGELLPDGFLERTKGRGLVVNTWVPQVDVLRHTSTGAFVTHCGWNSMLETTVAGVPMLCWPLYAEQKINKVFIVEEVGVEIVGWKEELVVADEVARKVKLVMESAQGDELRQLVAAHRERGGRAWKDGGSSRAAFAKFLVNVETEEQAPTRKD